MDRFMHEDGMKAQDVQLRGGRLYRVPGPKNGRIAERSETIEKAGGKMGRKPAGKQKGVSGYLKSKKKTLKELEEAGNI